MPHRWSMVPKSRQITLNDGSVVTHNREDVARFTWDPGKVTGGFISFPDGSKFRRSTNYARCVYWVEPKSPERTVTRWDYPRNTGKFDTSPGGYFSDVMHNSLGWDILSPQVPHVTNPPDIHSTLRNQCVTKALGDLADAKANIGENLATLSQIIRLVKDPLTTIVKEVKKIREKKSLWNLFNRSYRELAQGRALDGAAREYLKYVYGWKPLVRDIYGIMELAKEAGNRPLLIHATGRGRSERFHANRKIDHNDIVRTNVHDVTSMSRGSCSLWAQPDPNWAGARSLNQLGLLNPASLAWELVPASFVVDWVLPIGPVLQALTATAGLSFVNGSISQRVSARWAYNQAFLPFSGIKVLSTSPATGLAAYEGYRREELQSWPRPGFWFDPDPLRLKRDGSDRIFKALALSLLSMKSL